MYRSPTSGLAHEQEPSEVVRDLARQLRVQAEAIDLVLRRLRAAEHLDWESPAGRNFRSFLGERTTSLVVTTARLREAAVSMDAYGSALQLVLNGSQV
ncbi:SgrR family transcriptional regulator [Arthrobacter sp.]|uniref:SgrR family transcriptional regulator n=1 Tax=Arthrobacter sp. TaxID=1667 RepID=UPI002810E6BC|nr:SgrR family transcriptional regulator [Arthrobacter sp.]